MTTEIRLAATKLPPGKKGILTADKDGYYSIMLGGLNVLNSAREKYTATSQVLAVFKDGSPFYRRLQSGYVYSEFGHPKREPYMKDQEYLERLYSIDPDRICSHIRAVKLDPSYGSQHPEFNMPGLIGIIGEIKPWGPLGSHVQSALENPSQNCQYSVRALTKDSFYGGRTEKEIRDVINWDWVVEPGIAPANKWASPAVEEIALIPVTFPALEAALAHLPAEMCLEGSRALLNDSLACLRADLQTSHPFLGWSNRS